MAWLNVSSPCFLILPVFILTQLITKIYSIYVFQCAYSFSIPQNQNNVNFLHSFLPFFRHAWLPFSAILGRLLNLKEDSSVVGKLRVANNVLQLAMEKLDNTLDQNAQWHNKYKVFSRSFPIGCKLFIYNSQRNKMLYKLAQ